jgi:sulfur-oxidizing protein SoxY
VIKGLVDIQRRAVIKKTLSASTLAMVAASDLLLPQRVLAHWPTDAFSAETVEDVLLALLGQADVAVGQMLNFSVGKPAKHIVDGQSVSVEIDSELEDIERLVILVDNNPFPLVMSLDFTRDVLLPLKTRVKIVDGESQLMVVVRSGGQLYKTVQTLRVDISGNP